MPITQGEVHGKHFFFAMPSVFCTQRGAGMGPAAHKAPTGLAVLLAGTGSSARHQNAKPFVTLSS